MMVVMQKWVVKNDVKEWVKMKKRLQNRGSLDRKELSTEIIIAGCGPELFEMENFIYECAQEFL